MKLGTLKDGTRDGTLVVVSRDLRMAQVADAWRPTSFSSSA
jgi:fumarylacetoacetate (FAA) hydrolase